MKKEFIWRCPSNIALVKYWGKKDNQIPCNASLSMTLQNAFTEVQLTLMEKRTSSVELIYFFENKENEAFGNRVREYLEKNASLFPVVNDFGLQIRSVNSFPHSTGIASSASAFGAIALALLSASGYTKEDFLQRAGFLSRLGSGSACRSMYGGFALWGKIPGIKNTTDEYAIPLEGVHENFSDMRDAILIVDDAPKEISSSKGHALMNGHLYAQTRFQQGNTNCKRLLNVMQAGDLGEFIIIIEQEALALHAMMMTSQDAYLLLKPGTIHAIEMIRKFRKETHIPVCFTLDAGPNVHVLYSGRDEQKVHSFLKSELGNVMKGIIYDRTGKGPEQIF